MKKIAFLSNGCQGGFYRAHEIIAANPNWREVHNPEQSDVLVVNFCAISTEKLDAFDNLRREIINYKKLNPELRVIAGGCIAGLAEKRDLSFADATFHHQNTADVLMAFLEEDQCSPLAPYIMKDIATINIALGCDRRCSFCKVHFLKHMQLTSRPMNEILDLAQQAIAKKANTIVLTAENSTEYGIDIGTNLQTLLEQLLAMDGLQTLSVYGLCLDEVTPKLLETLKHPKIHILQLEVQSLNDKIRKNMNLHKTTSEAVAILDALSDKFLVSNLMTEFPGHSSAEFNREMHIIQTHHLYYLSLDPYDDTLGTPSHRLYKPTDKATSVYYQQTFLQTVAKERQTLLNQLISKDSVEALVMATSNDEIQLCALHYTVKIQVKQPRHCYRIGDRARVKITGLQENPAVLLDFTVQNLPSTKAKQVLEIAKYFDITDDNQSMLVTGQIVGFAS